MEFLKDLLADRRRACFVGGGFLAILVVYLLAGGGSPPPPPPAPVQAPVAAQPPAGSDAVAESWGMPAQHGEFWLDDPEAYQGAQDVGD